MSKYIIKNCPVYNTKHSICNKKSKVIKCSDITDCLLKQIVEECKEYKEECKLSCIDDRMCSTCFLGGKQELAEEILSLLDISEVE